MTCSKWIVSRLTRYWLHPDPGLRLAFRCYVLAILCLAMLGTAFFKNFILGAEGLVMLLLLAWPVLLHLRRAQRMMGGDEGLAAAARWAWRNGDTATRLGHLTLAGTVVLAFASAVMPSLQVGGMARLLPCLPLVVVTMMLLKFAHMGRARELARRRRKPLAGSLMVILGFLGALSCALMSLEFLAMLTGSRDGVAVMVLAATPLMFAGYAAALIAHSGFQSRLTHLRRVLAPGGRNPARPAQSAT